MTLRNRIKNQQSMDEKTREICTNPKYVFSIIEIWYIQNLAINFVIFLLYSMKYGLVKAEMFRNAIL